MVKTAFKVIILIRGRWDTWGIYLNKADADREVDYLLNTLGADGAKVV